MDWPSRSCFLLSLKTAYFKNLDPQRHRKRETERQWVEISSPLGRWKRTPDLTGRKSLNLKDKPREPLMRRGPFSLEKRWEAWDSRAPTRTGIRSQEENRGLGWKSFCRTASPLLCPHPAPRQMPTPQVPGHRLTLWMYRMGEMRETWGHKTSPGAEYRGNTWKSGYSLVNIPPTLLLSPTYKQEETIAPPASRRSILVRRHTLAPVWVP